MTALRQWDDLRQTRDAPHHQGTRAHQARPDSANAVDDRAKSRNYPDQQILVK